MEGADRFALGRVYRRADLHARYGGQRQGGISTPRDEPLILVFTGPAGVAHGYQDGWDDDGVFHYSGEGQGGSMSFSRGNKAIRDHAEEEKELHLFEQLGGGRHRYVGEMVCSGYEWRPAPDSSGEERQAIVFQLVRASAVSGEEIESTQEGSSLTRLAKLADSDPTEEGAPKAGLHKTYARSAALRDYVRARAEGNCEGCGAEAPFRTKAGLPYLEAHHTNRLSDMGPGNRRTVIALCPNCHRRVHHSQDGDAYNEQLKAKLHTIPQPG